RFGASDLVRVIYGGAVNSDDLPLSRLGLDRDTARRMEPGLLEQLAGEPGTRVLTVRGGQVLADFSAGHPGLVTTPVAEVDGSSGDAIWRSEERRGGLG